MQFNSILNGKLFFDAYIPTKGDFHLVEFGFLEKNGSLKDFAPKNVNFIQIDFNSSNHLEKNTIDPYALPIESESVDAVVCTASLEQVEMFWLVFLEGLRILKPNGLFYLNCPTHTYSYKASVNCWLFNKDTTNALINWGKKNGYEPALLETYLGKNDSIDLSNGKWNDFVAVFIKDESYQNEHPSRIIDHHQAFETNWYDEESDPQTLQLSPEKLNQLHALQQEIAVTRKTISDLRSELAQSHSQVADLLSSTCWQITAPIRRLKNIFKK